MNEKITSKDITWIKREEIRELGLFLDHLINQEGTIPLIELNDYKDVRIHEKKIKWITDFNDKIVKRFKKFNLNEVNKIRVKLESLRYLANEMIEVIGLDNFEDHDELDPELLESIKQAEKDVKEGNLLTMQELKESIVYVRSREVKIEEIPRLKSIQLLTLLEDCILTQCERDSDKPLSFVGYITRELKNRLIITKKTFLTKLKRFSYGLGCLGYPKLAYHLDQIIQDIEIPAYFKEIEKIVKEAKKEKKNKSLLKEIRTYLEEFNLELLELSDKNIRTHLEERNLELVKIENTSNSELDPSTFIGFITPDIILRKKELELPPDPDDIIID